MFALIVTLMKSQGVYPTWVKGFSDGGQDFIRSSSEIHDATGNVYFAGIYGGAIDFDPGPGSYTLNSSGPIFVCKLNSSGSLVWAKGMGSFSTTTDQAMALAVDNSGNVYITGAFYNTGDFDPGSGTQNLTSVGQTDIFINKLDASGNFVWAKGFGGSLADIGYGISIDVLGNVYTTGNYAGIADLDPGSTVSNYTAVGLTDIFVNKLDASGNFIWAKSLGGASIDEAKSIKVDLTGNVYISGSYQGPADFDPGLAVYNLTGNGQFVSKLDASGNFMIAKTIVDGVNTNHSLFVDAVGNIYTTGQYIGTSDFDPGAGTYTMSSFGPNFNIYVSKLDVSGNFLWAKTMGGSNYNSDGYSVVVDGTGNVYTTGEFSGTADFDPGTSNYTLTSAGGYDIFISKLDTLGNFIWAKKIGSMSNDRSVAMSIDANKNLYLTGYINGIVDFDTGIGVYNLDGPYEKVFVLKLCQMGLVSLLTSGPTMFCDGGSVTLSSSSASTYSWSSGATTSSIIVNTSGGYSVVSTGTNGCAAVNIVSVTVYPNPTITLNNGFICQGNSHTLVPTGATTYSFLNGSSVVSPTITTTYSVIGTSVNGCNSLWPGVSTITVSSLPLPTITVSSGTLCLGNSFTLSPTGADVYTFSSGTPVVSPSISTNYTVTGINLYGCTGFAIATITVSQLTLPTLSVNSGSICTGQSFTIIPNGALTYTYTGGVSIVSPTINTTYSVSGTDIAGCRSIIDAVCQVIVYANPTVTVNSGSICSGNSFTMSPIGANVYVFQGGSAIVNPIVSSSYTVSGTSAEGCVSVSNTVSYVTVYPSPTIAVNSGSICLGNSFTLIPTGGSAYNIEGNNTVVNPSITTSYTVIGFSVAGCVSQSYATSNIIVNLLPTISVNSGSICAGETFTMVPVGASTYSFEGGSALVNPTTSTVYTVSGISVEGCSSGSCAYCSVIVNPNPTISVANGSICAGDSFTIMPMGADIYTIQGGSGVVSPLTNTSYTLAGSNSFGCVSLPVMCTLTVANTPNLEVVSNPSFLCVGESATLIAGGANFYLWNNINGDSTLIITPGNSTYYSVKGTNQSGCSSTGGVTVIVDLCEGIMQSLNTKTGFRVFPNPFHSKVTIQLEESKMTINVFDTFGSKLMDVFTESKEMELDLSRLPQGIYIIKAGAFIKRVLKE